MHIIKKNWLFAISSSPSWAAAIVNRLQSAPAPAQEAAAAQLDWLTDFNADSIPFSITPRLHSSMRLSCRRAGARSSDVIEGAAAFDFVLRKAVPSLPKKG